MDRNTLSEYGWIIVTIILCSVLITFGTTFGAFIHEKLTSDVDYIVSMNEEPAEEVPAETYTVSGDIYGCDGSSVSITLLNKDGRQVASYFASDGHYVLEEIPVGEYTLRASMKGSIQTIHLIVRNDSSYNFSY